VARHERAVDRETQLRAAAAALVAATTVEEIERAAAAAAVAFASSFLFFVQLRVADEFKDFEEDARHRPERPVPRGLVSLRELGGLAALAALAQLGLALWLNPALAAPLIIAWAYLGLMTAEFFVPAWLAARPGLYLVSHLVILPLVGLFASACIWLPAGPAPAGLGWFLAVCFGTGAVLEIGRKLRAPCNERPEFRTYSAAWGGTRAVGVWLAALVLTSACAVMAARGIGFLMPAATVLVLLLAAAAVITGRFLVAPDAGAARRFETFSGVWTLLVYLSVGVGPMCWYWWSSGLGSGR
jgi:4-hydroxybenzoate polyprenyltransferase